jgi:hypothetical protein
MSGKALAVFLVLLILLVAVAGTAVTFQQPKAINFFFTGDTQGFLVPCGCRTVPAGGLARRTGALEILRSEVRGEAVIPVEITHGFADRGPARAVLNAEMGSYFAREGTVAGLGSYDLLLGLEALRKAAPSVPLLLAGYEGLEGSREYRLGGWGYGNLGLGGKRLRLVVLAQTAPEGVPLGDPLKAFERERRLHPADAYIAAGQLSPETVAALLKGAPGLLAVVAQWQTTVTSIPQQVEGKWAVYIGDRGRRLATLRVALTGAGWAVLPELRYLGPETPSDPTVEAEVHKVLGEVAARNKAALADSAVPGGDGPAYVGSERCAPCHAGAHRVWSLSGHSRATADLAIDHQQDNPDCLACHATGMGRPGGFPNSSVDLSGVQCEACHGPGEGHPPRALIAPKPSRGSCACHGPRDSPLFDPEGYWALVKHGEDGGGKAGAGPQSRDGRATLP